jgi:hypothetical protein
MHLISIEQINAEVELPSHLWYTSSGQAMFAFSGEIVHKAAKLRG